MAAKKQGGEKAKTPDKAKTAKKDAARKDTAKKDKRARKKRKDAQFVLRLDRELRDVFVDICAEMDTTAAREIRRFIKRFIAQHQDEAT